MRAAVSMGGLMERAILFRFWSAWTRIAVVPDGGDESVLVDGRARLGRTWGRAGNRL